MEEWKPWQQKVLDVCATEPNSRDINWVYDPVGNNGKTFLCEYLIRNMGAMVAGGKLADMKYAFDDHKIVVFDVPRDMSNDVNALREMYQFAECVKGGFMLSTKYETVQKVFKRPHVFFFANFSCPGGVFSEDRLKLIEV